MPPENPDELNALERMRRGLYTPATPKAPSQPNGGVVTVPGVPAQTPGSDTGWGTPSPVEKKKQRTSGPVIFLGVAIGFFVLAVAVAAYFLVVGTRSVSTDHIDLRDEGRTAL